jgi:DNA mismatch repair protein MutS
LANAISDEGFCKVECNDRYGHYLSMTKKRWETASASASTPPPGTQWKEFKATAISSSSSVVRITHPIIDTLSHTLAAEQKKLGSLATECYRRFLETIGEHVATALEQVAAILGDMDVHQTNARNALDFCYTRPNVSINTNPSKSFLDAKQLRHPIIERIQTQTPYVPNDVALGTQGTDGWLLYGINAAGKSSLMKAIGLNVLMAQAGMFVPCASLTYEPYDYIFTRISGADNIYRGMSSFTVEMTELRNILMRCNARSLVLGDELCAGTESLSALSIVAAGVETLAETQASFVFATHLHELVSLGTLPNNVSIFHIHIEMDPESQTITYDRHLTPGVGHSHYGLEVCRALALPDAFLKRAHAYRRKIQDEPQTFMNPKPSNYNKSLFVDRCALCTSPATETHHIRYQRDAIASRSKKHIQHIPVHSIQNLVPLCDACHLKEHHGELHIHGFQQTSAGRTLKVSYSSATPNQNLDNTSR